MNFVLLFKQLLYYEGHPQQPKKPLLRLRVVYTEDQELFEPLR